MNAEEESSKIPEAVEGKYGVAQQVPIPDIPSAAETVVVWLITAPPYHPLWSQYVLLVVRLRSGIPGFPEPKRAFIGATHELVVAALDPSLGPYNPTGLVYRMEHKGLPFLTPINIAEQFEASDEEMAQLAYLTTHGVVDGVLNPETGDAPETIRFSWKTAMVLALAHHRGEPHVRPGGEIA